MSQDFSRQAKDLRVGTWAAIASYGMWGLFPIYWKQVVHIDAVQILCHRIFWSAIFLLIVMWMRGMSKQLIPIFKQKQSFMAVAICGVLITANWGTYIWAVNSGKVTESSLGYYITPLLSVGLGSLFFKEKMDRWTKTAVIIATLGVATAAAMMGKLPWIAVSLATTFSIYGAVKKKARLDALPGLAAETIAVAPFALTWLLCVHYSGNGGYFLADAKSTIFLAIAGPVTAIPLLAFAYAAVRIPLQRIGFIQYFSPTIQLMLGLLVFGERMNLPMALAFATVVCAVVIYSSSISKSRSAISR
ncbi:MAG: EamA family transporter RarD [Holophagales bacterium]|nr:EamA family transporter RarD [Holophagales bacterium]